jgi:hypothetical protein
MIIAASIIGAATTADQQGRQCERGRVLQVFSP